MGASGGVGGGPGSLSVYSDPRGSLSLTEFDSLPFMPARAYVLHDIPVGARRGGHAHRIQHRFLAFVAGSAMVIEDDGAGVERRQMGAGDCLHVPPETWHEIEALDEDLVILVLASGRHDPADYIHDRRELAVVSASQTAST